MTELMRKTPFPSVKQEVQRKEKLAKAKKDIELEIEKANDQIRDEIVDVAMKASEKLIGKNITNDDNKKLVDDFIDEQKKIRKDSEEEV
mgnify:CR=1 FL=1